MHRKSVWLFFVLAAALAAVLPCADNGFTNWDDDKYVTENPQIRQLSWAGVKDIFTSFHYGLYKPLVIASYAVEYRFFGLNPRPYHITNIALHLANTALVFALIFALTGSLFYGVFVSLLFGVHPMHAESVAWVTERKDMLYSLFFLSSCWLYVVFAKTGGVYKYLLSLLAFAISLAAKPMGVTLPAVLLLFDYYLARGNIIKAVKEKIPFFAVAAGFAAMTLLVLRRGSGIVENPDYSVFDKLLFAAYSFVFYIKKAVWPADLSALYPYPAKLAGFLPLEYWVSAAVLVLILFLAARYGLKRPAALFGLLFFAVTVFPVLQWLPVGQAVAADRYTYVPYIGLFFAAAAIVLELLPLAGGGWAYRAVCCAAALAVLMAVGATRARCRVWHDSRVLWEDVLRQFPDSALAYNNLGQAYIAEGDAAAAVAAYNRSLALNISNADVYNNRAAAFRLKGDAKQEIEGYMLALKADPTYADAYYNLGIAYATSGELDKAEASFNKALEINPRMAVAYNNMGNMMKLRKNSSGARALYEKALSADPKYTAAYNNIALLDLDEGRPEEAKSVLLKAADIDRYDCRTYFNLGNVEMSLGDKQAALRAYLEAVKINPAHDGAYVNLGNIYAGSGDRQKAGECYAEAVRLNPKSAGGHYNLAIILFGRGLPEQALMHAEKAAALGYNPDAGFIKSLKKSASGSRPK